MAAIFAEWFSERAQGLFSAAIIERLAKEEGEPFGDARSITVEAKHRPKHGRGRGTSLFIGSVRCSGNRAPSPETDPHFSSRFARYFGFAVNLFLS